MPYDARSNNLPMLTQHYTCIGRYTATVDTELYAPGQQTVCSGLHSDLMTRSRHIEIRTNYANEV